MKVKYLLKEKGTDIIKIDAKAKTVNAVHKMINRNLGALMVDSYPV